MQARDPGYKLLCEEIFGPVLTAYVYDDAKWKQTLALVDSTSPYALTGAIFAQDRLAAREAMSALRDSVGISKSVMVVGIINKMEIWSKAAWDARKSQTGDKISEALSSLGL